MKINAKVVIAIVAFIAGILINRYFNNLNTKRIINTLTGEINKIKMRDTNHLSPDEQERIKTLQQEIDLMMLTKPKSILPKNIFN